MQSIRSDDAPKAIGPYSQAIAYKDLLFLSGQIPINPSSGNVEATSIEDQTEQVMNNLRAVLISAGSDLSRVLKCTVFLTDLKDFNSFNAVYGKHFGDMAPARSTVQVAKLPKDVKIEIEAIAYRVP